MIQFLNPILKYLHLSYQFFWKHALRLRLISRNFIGDALRSACNEVRAPVSGKWKVALLQATLEALANAKAMWSPRTEKRLQKLSLIEANGWDFVASPLVFITCRLPQKRQFPQKNATINSFNSQHHWKLVILG